MRRIRSDHDNSMDLKDRIINNDVDRNMNLGRSSIRMDGQDRIYYNISIPHNDELSTNGSPTAAIFEEVRSEALFNDFPKDFSMSVVRFTIPTAYIPLHYFPVIPNPNDLTMTDPNYGLNSVTLSYNGSDFQTHVIYKPQNLWATVPPAPIAGSPQSKKYIDYYSIYSIEWELEMFNTAFSISFAKLKATFPAAPVTLAPYLEYSPAAKLFSLVAQTGYNSSNPSPVQIFMNNFSYELFETSFDVINNGWSSNITNGKNIQFIVNNKGNNFISNAFPSSVSYPYAQPWSNTIDYMAAQNTIVSYIGSYWIVISDNIASPPSLVNPNWAILQSPSLNNPQVWDTTVTYLAANNTIVSWNGLYWIVLINNTGSEPAQGNTNWGLYQGFDSYRMTQDYSTVQQWSPFTNITLLSNSLPFRSEWVSGGNTTQQRQGQTGVKSQIFRPILTDFEIDLNTGFETRSFIHYVPTAEYRRIDLIGNTPIINIDIQVFWKDNYDNFYPVMIPAHQEVSIKILFERKKKSHEILT